MQVANFFGGSAEQNEPLGAASGASLRGPRSSLLHHTALEHVAHLFAEYRRAANRARAAQHAATSCGGTASALVRSPRLPCILASHACSRSAAPFAELRSLSSYRVCADAAANRLRDSIRLAIGEDEAMVTGGPAVLRQRLLQLQQVARQHESMVPDTVTGDFDSIRTDVLDFYRQRGCLIAHNPAQDSTDFEKALEFVQAAQASTLRACAGPDSAPSPAARAPAAASSSSPLPSKKWTVVAFGAFGDRFDHELASINVLYKFNRAFERLLLMGERMTATLLAPGRHRILPDPNIEGPTCGLLPIGGAADAVSTTGLRWDLKGQPLRFGGLVSSSNQLQLDADGRAEVTVTTSHPIVWTTVLRPEGWPRTPPNT